MDAILRGIKGVLALSSVCGPREGEGEGLSGPREGEGLGGPREGQGLGGPREGEALGGPWAPGYSRWPWQSSDSCAPGAGLCCWPCRVGPAVHVGQPGCLPTLDVLVCVGLTLEQKSALLHPGLHKMSKNDRHAISSLCPGWVS